MIVEQETRDTQVLFGAIQPMTRFPEAVVLIDGRGDIVAVSGDWTAVANRSTIREGIRTGENYFEVCRRENGTPLASRKALVGIRGVLKEKSSSFVMDYECRSALGARYFRMTATPISHAVVRAAIIHTDVTDLRLSKREDLRRLQQFARRLIHAQELERHRISREIHDDVGNRLALMSLSLRHLMTQIPSSARFQPQIRELDKILDYIAEASASLRNLSHGLQPPTLRCLGVSAALKALGDGFRNTHAIDVNVTTPPDMPRLSEDIELCIFRITQECLQNAAKHSGADKVRVILERTAKRVQLTVIDNGCGFDRAAAMQKGGLGLLSMEERALSVRGRLSISTAPGEGAEVRLIVPVQSASSRKPLPTKVSYASASTK
jgi:signal transduction histidine kinase